MWSVIAFCVNVMSCLYAIDQKFEDVITTCCLHRSVTDPLEWCHCIYNVAMLLVDI